jgi:type IV secretion system protein VirB8
LLSYKGQDPAEGLLQFLLKNYVVTYEEYNIETFDRNINGIKKQSSDAVTAEFQRLIDPNNPDSPLTLYQRHSQRSIAVLSVRSDSEMRERKEAEVVFEATVTSRTEIKNTRWLADITFDFNGLELDEETGKVKPFAFQVTSYRTKRLQDIE